MKIFNTSVPKRYFSNAIKSLKPKKYVEYAGNKLP